MDSPDVCLLVDMGFPQDRAVKALSITGNKGVEAAMEWLLAHSDEFETETAMTASLTSNSSTVTSMETQPSSTASVGIANPSASSSSTTEPGPSKPTDPNSEPPQEAKSLRCDECEKLFRSSAEVEYHAAKTGHSQFSESTEEKKPLTEEERQAQLKLLEEKMRLKRKEREEREKQEQLDREKNRIKTGKEISAARRKLEEEEMKKVLDARKREKEEEIKARQRVKEQIEADKAARRAKAAAAAGIAPPEEPVKQTPEPTSPISPPQQKDYSQTRLQIRLMNGNALTQTFSSKEQLSAVRLFVEMNRTDGDQPFSFMTSFPRKVYSSEDYEKPLDVLGLVPSAVLILIKPQ